MSDVFNMREGILSWVSASGNSNAWATGASSPSGSAIAFIRDFTFGSGQTINTVMNRGVPNHHKIVDAQPISVSFTYGYSGLSGVPHYPVHLEFKLRNPITDASAYFHFHNSFRTTHDFTENAEENTLADAFVALGMTHATASGYLS
jgi:hypothetical protein